MRHSKPGRLGKRNYRLVGTVFNCAYAVRLETAPTGGESVYLFLESTIILGIVYHLRRKGARYCS